MHEWIENYHEYEAVLQCTNQLELFESTVVLRAFQTFGWNDASTPGNDNSFVHEESGTIVRYEGALLAIDCGHDRLTEALADLVSVLHGLGWVSVEVYHARETIKALMTDIGKAIPANMKNFDVKPAAVDKPVSDFPESAALIEKGRAVMQMGGLDAANGAVLEELQSMVPQPISSPASKEKHAIILLDDEPYDSETGASSVPFTGAPVSRASEALPLSGGPVDPESEEPAVFNLPTAEASAERPAPIIARTVEPIQPHPDSTQAVTAAGTLLAAIQPAGVVVPSAAPSVPDQGRELQAYSGHSGIISNAMHTQVVEGRSDSPETATIAAIDLGSSTIVFDSPDHPVSRETVEAMFSGRASNGDGYYKDVVYVRPGSVGERWRWDLLGELSVEKPWFAENLVDAMGLDGPAAMLMSLILTEARAADETAQLRDVLTALVDGDDVRGASRITSHLAGQLRKYCDVDVALAQIVAALAPLMLCPTGLAVVDRHLHDDSKAGMFTMRALLTSSDALLLVVQVDALDGRFAHWLTYLMRAVATAYGASKMYQVVAQLVANQRNIEHELHQVETAKAELGAKVTAITGEYFERLRDLGCDLPRLSGSHS